MNTTLSTLPEASSPTWPVPSTQAVESEIALLSSLIHRVPSTSIIGISNANAIAAEILTLQLRLSLGDVIEVFDIGLEADANTVFSAMNAAEWLAGDDPRPTSEGWLNLIEGRDTRLN